MGSNAILLSAISALFLFPAARSSAQILNALGQAGPSNFTILSLGGAGSQIQINGNGNVQGDAGIASGGVYNMSGSAVLAGGLYLSSQANEQISGGATIQGEVHQGQDAFLNAALSSALSASSSFSQLAPTISIEGNAISLQGGQSTTITGVFGTNVLNLKGILLSGGSSLIISAPPGGQFVINNSGDFEVSGGSKILLQGGLISVDVVFNETGQHVELSGNSSASGIILASNASINLQGTFTGELIGGPNQMITISGNSQVLAGVATAAQLSAALSVQQSAAALFQPGVDPSAGLATLSKNPAVLQCGLSPDNTTIWVEYVGGIEGLISRSPPGSLGGDTPAIASGRSNESVRSQVSTSVQALSGSASVVFPSSSNYIGLYPFADHGLGLNSSTISQDVSNACTGPSFTSLPNQQVVVDTFKDLGNFGIIYIESHGLVDHLGLPTIATREIATGATRMQHGPDLNAHALVLTSIGDSNVYFSVTPIFFERNYGPGALPGSIVIANSCSSFASDQMAKAFVLRGAQAYVGWTSIINSFFGGESIMSSLFSGLSNQSVPADSRTLQQVLSTIPTFAPFANLEPYGSGNVSMCSPFLVIQKAGNGAGTVTSAPAGINCGPQCKTQTNPFDGRVTLTALADSGSTFAGWSGDCAGNDLSTTVNVTTGKTNCTATFQQGQTHSISISACTFGLTVRSNPPGLAVTDFGTAAFPANSTVTLFTDPATVVGWWKDGDFLDFNDFSSGVSITVVMNTDLYYYVTDGSSCL